MSSADSSTGSSSAAWRSNGRCCQAKTSSATAIEPGPGYTTPAAFEADHYRQTTIESGFELLRFLRNNPNGVEAGVAGRAKFDGDGTTWRCGWTPGRGWYCDCPVTTTECSHLLALRLITDRTLP